MSGQNIGATPRDVGGSGRTQPVREVPDGEATAHDTSETVNPVHRLPNPLGGLFGSLPNEVPLEVPPPKGDPGAV